MLKNKRIHIVSTVIVIWLLNLTTIHENVAYAYFEKFHLVDEDDLIEQQAGVVNILDPDTKEIIKQTAPEDFILETNFEQYKKEIEKLVEELAWGVPSKTGYNKLLILDRLDSETGKLIKGRPEITLKEEELVRNILEKSFTGGNVVVPLAIKESGYRAEDIPYFNEVVLASYTTVFNYNKIGRSKNIELSAASINNVIVGSGDYFSFNMTVGPREVATGYQVAPEFLKGKVVTGIGGGICQTSSTLFNAVDQLGVEILERHHHSRDIGYVPKGRDATVSFGGLDFLFRNTTGIPFLIKTYYGKGYITVELRTTKEYEDLLKNELTR